MTLDYPFDSSMLRYAVSAHEFELLHHYLTRTRRRAAPRSTLETKTHEKTALIGDDYHAAALRSSLRVLLGTAVSLRTWDWVSTSLFARSTSKRPRPQQSLLQSPNFRLALSLSLILYLHRLLHRFFIRLRLRLLKERASRLRERYPRLCRGLTSRIAPAIGASLAGFSLGIYPSDQFRITVAIYTGARALELLYNALDKDGYLGKKPWWFGSWILLPLSQGQLFHAFVFDRDCAPKVYGDFIVKHTPNYIQRRPPNVSPSLLWPLADQIVDTLSEVAMLKWPPFVSPILHPANSAPLPASIDPIISPITSRAHPSIQHLSCALIHPSDPSCFSAYLSHSVLSYGSLARFFALFYAVMALARYHNFIKAPLLSLSRLAKTIAKTTAVTSGAIGASWGSICLFAAIFPRSFLPRFRFFLGGFIGGCFQFLDRTAAARANSMYATRLSVDSLWKVGVKHGWWKGVQGGDLLVFVAALALLDSVYELREKGVEDKGAQTVMKLLRGDLEIGLRAKSQEQVSRKED